MTDPSGRYSVGWCERCNWYGNLLDRLCRRCKRKGGRPYYPASPGRRGGQ